MLHVFYLSFFLHPLPKPCLTPSKALPAPSKGLQASSKALQDPSEALPVVSETLLAPTEAPSAPSMSKLYAASEAPFGKRTRRGRYPIEQRGEISVRLSVRTNGRTNERTKVRPSPQFLSKAIIRGPSELLRLSPLGKVSPSSMRRLADRKKRRRGRESQRNRIEEELRQWRIWEH